MNLAQIIFLQRCVRKRLIRTRLKSFLKICDSICSESNFQTFMKDTRVLQLIFAIFKHMSIFHTHSINMNSAPRMLMSLMLFHKYHESYLSGVVGMEMYMIVELTRNALLDVSKTPNTTTIAYFIEHFNNFTLFFDIWKHHDMRLYIEQVAHYIYELKQQLGEDPSLDTRIQTDIAKRKQQIITLTDDPGILDFIDTYSPFDKQLESRIREAFDKAFHDKLLTDISNSPPDYSFIIENIRSLHDRILSLTPHNSSQQEYIQNHFELEYLEHLLENNAFDPESFYTYAQKFKTIFEQYHAPVDTQSCNTDFQSFFDSMLTIDVMNHQQYASLLIEFFQLCEKHVQTIEDRIQSFYDSLTKN